MFSNLYSILKHGLKKDSSLPERSSADLPELEIEESLDDLCAQDEEPHIAQDEELANSQKEEYEKAAGATRPILALKLSVIRCY